MPIPPNDDGQDPDERDILSFVRIFGNHGSSMLSMDTLLPFVQKQIGNVTNLRRAARQSVHGLQERETTLNAAYIEPSLFETRGFDDFSSLRFLYATAIFGKQKIAETRVSLEKIVFAAEHVDQIAEQLRGHQEAVVQILSSLDDVAQEGVQILRNSLLLEQQMQAVYGQAVGQYKYLQARFIKRSRDDSAAVRRPDEEHERGDPHSSSGKYVRTPLYQRNPLLTSVFLDFIAGLPHYYVTGKTKTKKQTRTLDRFEVEHNAQMLCEIATPRYLDFLRHPDSHLQTIAETLRTLYDALKGVDEAVKQYVDAHQGSPTTHLHIDRQLLLQKLYDPRSLLERYKRINYLSIQPDEDDLRPQNPRERQYFAAQMKLFEHLAGACDQIEAASDWRKREIAEAAVEKAIKLRDERDEIYVSPLKKPGVKRAAGAENEFYVLKKGHLSAVEFVREEAPQVRMSDVMGRSFDVMRGHIDELVDFTRYSHLYAATAPRGKLRSNMIAIGPYGCGKTEIARAVLGDPRFIGAEVQVSDLLTAWFGEFESNVNRVWDGALELRRASRNSKLVVLAMDEFDSWFTEGKGEGSGYGSGAFSRAQKTIQAKLDGVREYEGVVVIGMTNEPAQIPLAIYRRFKYEEDVGNLGQDERRDLLRKFVTNGLPLSRGFTDAQWDAWAEKLGGATGDVIGKVADEMHLGFMTDFTRQYGAEARRMNTQIRRAYSRGDSIAVKGMIGKYMRVTPEMVEDALTSRLADPVIQNQITVAQGIYRNADKIMKDLAKRKDPALGDYGRSVIEGIGRTTPKT